MERGVWDFDTSIDRLPKQISKLFSKCADDLYNELKCNKTRVVLIPAPEPRFDGHKIRMVENYNPDWYSNLYYAYQHFRRDRSLRSLDRIRDGKDKVFRASHKYARYKYDSIYRELIFHRLIDGYADNGYKVKPSNVAKSFFKNDLESKVLCIN